MSARAFLLGLGLAATLLAALPAAAQPPGPLRDPPMRGRFGDEPPPMPPAMAVQPPEMPLRDFLRGDVRPPGQGGLSREERRQLRRDIHEAGQDIYRRGPRHRRF
jgi:hypothetical protein